MKTTNIKSKSVLTINLITRKIPIMPVVLLMSLQQQICQGAEQNVQEWVKNMRQQGAEFTVNHCDCEHQTSLEATLIHDDQQQSYPFTIIHTEIPQSKKTYENPHKRFCDSDEIYQVSTVIEDYICPLQIFGIPDLEFEHRYTTKELSYIPTSFPTILLPPGLGQINRGYYTLSPSFTKKLPSSYLYSDGQSFFLTRCLQEDWHPIDAFGLPTFNENSIQVKYAMNTQIKLTLEQGWQINGSSIGFPGRGFYGIETGGIKRIEGDDTLFCFSNYLGTNTDLPEFHIDIAAEQNLESFFKDILNSFSLYPYVTSISFLGQDIPTKNHNSFIGLACLTKQLSHLNRLELNGRDLLSDSRLLGGLITPGGNNPKFINLFSSCQIESDYIEKSLHTLDISSLSISEQENVISSLSHFSLYLKNLELKNWNKLNDGLIANFYLGQLLHLNLEGCSQITNASVILLAENNPGLQTLNLSLTHIDSFALPRFKPVVFKNLQKLTLNNISSLLEINLESPLLTHISIDYCLNLDIMKLKKINLLEKLSCQYTKVKYSDLYNIIYEKKEYVHLNINGCGHLKGLEKKILETFSLGDNSEELSFYCNSADYRSSDIRDPHARLLSFNTKLSKLYLNNTGIGSDGIRALGQNKTLTTLNLDECCVHESIFIELIENLKNNQNLRNLSIGLKNTKMTLEMKQTLNQLVNQQYNLHI